MKIARQDARKNAKAKKPRRDPDVNADGSDNSGSNCTRAKAVPPELRKMLADFLRENWHPETQKSLPNITIGLTEDDGWGYCGCHMDNIIIGRLDGRPVQRLED